MSDLVVEDSWSTRTSSIVEVEASENMEEAIVFSVLQPSLQD